MTADEIKAARERLGLTQAELSRLLGYKPGGKASAKVGGMPVSRLERGAAKIDDGRARLLRAYLDGYRPKDWPGDP